MRRSLSYPCDPAIRQRLRAQMIARQVSDWRRLSRQLEKSSSQVLEASAQKVRRSLSFSDSTKSLNVKTESGDDVAIMLPFQSLLPCNGSVATETPNRKFLIRQKAVDRSLSEPLFDTLLGQQASSSVRSAELLCMQLTPSLSPIKTKLNSTDTTRDKRQSREQKPVKSDALDGDLMRVEDSKQINYINHRTEHFHKQNGHHWGSDTSSDDEGLGSGESLASSPEKSEMISVKRVKKNSFKRMNMRK